MTLMAVCIARAQESTPAPAVPATAVPAGAFSQDEKDLLAQLEDLIELHDWLGLLDQTDPQHREQQLKAGITHAQYVADLLGLFFDGNSIAGDNGKVETMDLDLIRQVSWKRKGRTENGMESILGTVQLKDGESLLLEVRWRKTPAGGYVLSGPLG
jgi:hypothetical protein